MHKLPGKLLRAVFMNNSCFNIPRKFKGRLAKEGDNSNDPGYDLPLINKLYILIKNTECNLMFSLTICWLVLNR